jgi:hypothetical protein
MTEIGVVDRYSTLAHLHEHGWHPVLQGAVLFERSFALMTAATPAGKAAALAQAMKQATAGMFMPRYTHEELRAGFKRDPYQNTPTGWSAEIRFKAHQPPYAGLGAGFTGVLIAPETEPARDAVLWMLRGYDSYEVITRATAEMRRLETAMRLGWRP